MNNDFNTRCWTGSFICIILTFVCVGGFFQVALSGSVFKVILYVVLLIFVVLGMGCMQEELFPSSRDVTDKAYKEKLVNCGLENDNDVISTSYGYAAVKSPHTLCREAKIFDINLQTGQEISTVYMISSDGRCSTLFETGKGSLRWEYDLNIRSKYFQYYICSLLFPAPEYIAPDPIRVCAKQSARATNLGEEYRKVQEYRKLVKEGKFSEIDETVFGDIEVYADAQVDY